ncbi:DUF3054 domain-containing protein [Agromyces salentinus]|uniref:DUF3054 domain-containing protein n=1 Tax=Agromyces salentinus TaxID=269421 RepID=A0ABN2MTX4_9MICO|nr:DUF3054 domain-containing protein [Agromyces salentinus]
MTSPSPSASSVEQHAVPAGRVAIAAVVDAVLVVGFALTGRSSHAEALDPAGLWGTAWPFLVGAAIGWLAIRAWRAPFAVWPTGVIVWASSVVLGMLLRALTGQGTALAFIVVATLTLGLLLVGWRAIAQLVLRARRRRAASASSSASPSAGVGA